VGQRRSAAIVKVSDRRHLKRIPLLEIRVLRPNGNRGQLRIAEKAAAAYGSGEGEKRRKCNQQLKFPQITRHRLMVPADAPCWQRPQTAHENCSRDYSGPVPM
jgi:hypothetical protein